MHKHLFPYAGVLLGVALTSMLASFAPQLFDLFGSSSDAHLLVTFFSISVICVLSFVTFHLSQNTVIPSFVVAIFFGLAARPLLMPLIEEREVLGAVVGFGATLILFGGGLETPFANFRKLLWKIASLSFIGLFLTALMFSLSVFHIGQWIGAAVPITVAILLGAVLASTDPAAIIPVLKQLRFKNRETKDLIVSESAVTDVTGTLLTLAFLGIVSTGTAHDIVNGYTSLFNATVSMVLFKEIVYGVVFGLLGYFLLLLFTRMKERHGKEYEADAAFFLFVPVIIFTVAVALGGSGYLAAFIAGLLYVLTKHLHETERFFNHTIEGFLKPTIFVLLGALVEINSLMQYAVLGILAGLVFMFVVRPIAVFLTLGPFSFFGKDRFSLRELLFISFVRETGAIPAVLLVTVVSLGIGGLDGLVPVGMWVILLTLVVEPPLTPVVARWLQVATPMVDEDTLSLEAGAQPFVVLGSRGHSFIDRLPYVVNWATRHGITRVVLLHCLEDKYTEKRAAEMGELARHEFEKLNKKREQEELPPVTFEYISRTGLLQDNIDQLSQEQSEVTAIFVGRKVLDYRLHDIRNLQVPLFFVD